MRLYEPLRYDARTVWIAVDSYDDQVPVGRFFCPAQGVGGRFFGLTQLLLQIDDCMDADDGPQAFHTVRTFSPRTGISTGTMDGITTLSGKLFTFTATVMYRRNSSWQGKLTWMEKGESRLFSSVLELVNLLNSAATEGDLRPLYSFNRDRFLDKAE